jgi:Flp pilus assembly protein TadG
MREFNTSSITRTPGAQGRRTPRRAAATLELALTLAILVNLTFGMVEFGYYFFVKNTMQGAAREGARAGIVSGATYSSSITSAVQGAMSAAGFSSASPKYSFTVTDTTTSVTITTDAQLAAVSSGDALQVSVQATWGTIGAGFRPMNLIGSSKIVVGTAVMRHE